MRRVAEVVLALVAAAVLLAVGFAAFTGYVAYCGMHEFKLPDAFERPPGPEAARYGAVLDAGLAWAMRVCGVVVTLVGVGWAMFRRSAGSLPAALVTLLAGALLVTQHWGAAVALGVAALGLFAGAVLRTRSPGEGAGRG